MNRQQIGTVAELWRYPVKSMLGERLPELKITTGGVIGDRAWALRELVNGRIATAKKWANLFGFHAAYTTEPSLGAPGSVQITLPDGRAIGADDPDVSQMLSQAIGRKMKLEHAQPEQRERAGIDPNTVFADVPVEQVIPAFTAATLPDQFKMPAGTFFDEATMHVVATGTLEHMRALRNGAGIYDPRRFRANIFVRTNPGLTGFVEDEWLGGVLEVGASVRIAGMYPALRCVMTTHPQSELPRDLDILRTAARHHKANVGVFAGIENPGIVRLADPVFLVK